ncbi:hypothetical protein BD410DRAFT_899285 [Rickenella mellea]|uniref:DUF6593 domain-containing protein n=1 Tax=Rickenella mellea TaxID=50990 RepID=A0A4Y7PZF5_9AGAM|nr:hypothetical protein BD410DRAFT_899285 [Rickenella mellea]
MDILRLTLRVHDPLNTVFMLPDGRPIYHIETSSGLFSLSGDVTTIKRVDGTHPTTIATIDWHRVSPSTIKFDGPTYILSDFLVPSSGLFSHSKTFQGVNGQIYKWKTDPVMLFNAQKRPAAIWDPGSTSIFSKTRLATLDVIGDAQQTLDTVVVSLVVMYFEIIRHRRRRHNHGPGGGFGGGGGMNGGAGNF